MGMVRREGVAGEWLIRILSGEDQCGGQCRLSRLGVRLACQEGHCGQCRPSTRRVGVPGQFGPPRRVVRIDNVHGQERLSDSQ